MSRQSHHTARTAIDLVVDELRDVNERLVVTSIRAQETSEAAQQDRARLRALLEALNEGVALVDGAGTVVLLNHAARRIMGLAPAAVQLAIIATLDFRRLDMTSLSEGEHPLARAQRGEAFLDTEMLLVRADGDARRVMTSCTTTMDRDRDRDRGALAIIVFRDITGRRELEARLAQTERLAAIGTLAAGVAHEINNPLAIVLTNIELALEGVRRASTTGSPSAREEIEAMLADARVGAERIRRVVSSLGTFATRAADQRSIVDVRAVLETAIDLTLNELRHRATLEKVFGDLPLVEVDDAELGRVFVNLLMNAAHALPETGGACNQIRIVTSTDRAGRAVIEISDTGPGIPPDVLPRIFDPFFTTKDVGAGAGLGLSICRNIVLAMGGEIVVESQLGVGTTSRIVLPPSATAPVAESPARVAPSRKATVLVVDDEPAIGVVLRRVLTAYDVTLATSVTQALHLIEGGTVFDVMLSDLMMPERSGIDFYEALQRIDPLLAARVVFVTGGAFTPVAAEFLARVPNERLRKPFEADHVRELLRKILASRAP
jgi:two-component system cell cycle sensor histidine kinase/response regulator CckA